MSSSQQNTLTHESDTGPLVTNFIQYYPWACKRLFPNYVVNVEQILVETTKTKTNTPVSSLGIHYKRQSDHTRHLEATHPSQTMRRSETMHPSQALINRMKSKSKLTFLNDVLALEKNIHIFALMDIFDNINEIVFDHGAIYSGMIKLFKLIIPYYSKLKSLTFKCKVNQHIIYEVSKILPVSNITHLCLDGAFVPQGNYYLLLSEPSALKSLSLARCSINDASVEKLIEHLCFPKKTCETLAALNLSSNYITDKGAKHFGEMLRGNRHLCYLNLSGNRITDVGLDYILETLIIFPLTFEEKTGQFLRLAAYIEFKNDLMQRLVEQYLFRQMLQKPKPRKTVTGKLEAQSRIQADKTNPDVPNQKPDSSLTTKSMTQLQDPILLEKARVAAEQSIGPFADPLGGINSQKSDNKPYCLGNNTLSYLNLAFNDLTYLCLEKILYVLEYQIKINRKPKGLLRVLIEGNRIPVNCIEFDRLEYYFSLNLEPSRKFTRKLSAGTKSIRKNNTASSVDSSFQ